MRPAASAGTVANNTIVDNSNVGIRVPSGTAPTISNSIIWGNDANDLLGCNATYSCIEDPNDANGVGNITDNPQLVDPNNDDYHLRPDSACIDAGDPNGDYTEQTDMDGDPRVIPEEVDIGADEVRKVHNTTQNTWYGSIQDAIDDSNPQDVIEVYPDPGPYYESIDFDGKAITVRSADPNDWSVVAATIIDANGADKAVYFHNSSTSVLRGFTITGADHGIYCNHASPVIENCVIRDNQDTGEDGAGMYNDDASPTVTGCVFSNNWADYGAGMYNYDESSPTVTNCLFYDNDADEYGGGMYNDYDSCPTIVNCTFFENDADYGGGIYNEDDSDAELTNCIFWDNDADDGEEIYNDDAEPNFSYCCIRGGLNGDYCAGANSVDGGGNIDDDPEFEDDTDPAGADNIWATCDDGLRIKSTSPCKDVGDNEEVPSGVDTDIKGSDRFINTTVDMGAYEYDSGC
ncbi:MAG: right-handed parallel beta-helix repeat-containing protein [Planctomycetota bacterium]